MLNSLWIIDHTQEDGISPDSIIKAQEIEDYLKWWNEKATTEEAENVIMDLAYILDVKITVHKED